MANVNVWGTNYNQNKNNNKAIDVYTGATPSKIKSSGTAATVAPGAWQTVQQLQSTLPNTQSQAAATTGTGTGSNNSIYSRSMDLMRKAAQMQMNNQLNTLKNSVSQLLNSYQTSQNALNQQLDADVNQNEVERYKAQRALRETLANRGALNSGAGRQEALNMSNAYSNRQNAIQQAYNTNMNDLRNNANASLAEIDLAYNDALQNTNSNIMQQLADYVAKGYSTNKDYTINDGSNWQNMLAELKKQYGL